MRNCVHFCSASSKSVKNAIAVAAVLKLQIASIIWNLSFQLAIVCRTNQVSIVVDVVSGGFVSHVSGSF